jgi:hypothetical protein
MRTADPSPLPGTARRSGRAALLVAGGVAVLAAATAAGWALAHRSAGTNTSASAQAPATATPPGRPPATAHATPTAAAHVLKPAGAVSFDPYGSGQAESSRIAALAIDASPATAWRTSWYASASFGNLKPGTGLLLDMGGRETITEVTLMLGREAGADLQLRVGDSAASLRDLRPVARATDAGGQVRLRLAEPARGRYVLIWFTKLPPDSSGTFQAAVYDISLRGFR